MTEAAIYHPLIDPGDPKMLRYAALHWDRLLTIVPESLQEPYQTPASREALAAGILQARRVCSEMPEVQRASEEFADDQNRRRVRTAGRRSLRRYGEQAIRLHQGKVEGRLRDALFPGPLDSEGFVQVGRSEGSAYMSKLASILAETDGVVPFTEESAHQEVITDRFVNSPSARGDDNLNFALATVSIRTVRLSERVPIADIVRFRHQNRELLTRYRRSIRQLLAGTRNSDSEEEVKNNIRQVANEQIAPDLDELENKLREKRFLSGLSYLDITQACSLGLLASDFQNWTIGLMGGSVSLGVSLYRSRRAKDAMMREAPYGYLLTARRRFAGY